jgi:preprotein translocase subunit SecY
MELGVTPIVTAGSIMQLLVGARIIEADFNIKEDHKLFNCAQKGERCIEASYCNPSLTTHQCLH